MKKVRYLVLFGLMLVLLTGCSMKLGKLDEYFQSAISHGFDADLKALDTMTQFLHFAQEEYEFDYNASGGTKEGNSSVNYEDFKNNSMYYSKDKGKYNALGVVKLTVENAKAQYKSAMSVDLANIDNAEDYKAGFRFVKKSTLKENITKALGATIYRIVENQIDAYNSKVDYYNSLVGQDYEGVEDIRDEAKDAVDDWDPSATCFNDKIGSGNNSEIYLDKLIEIAQLKWDLTLCVCSYNSSTNKYSFDDGGWSDDKAGEYEKNTGFIINDLRDELFKYYEDKFDNNDKLKKISYTSWSESDWNSGIIINNYGGKSGEKRYIRLIVAFEDSWDDEAYIRKLGNGDEVSDILYGDDAKKNLDKVFKSILTNGDIYVLDSAKNIDINSKVSKSDFTASGLKVAAMLGKNGKMIDEDKLFTSKEENKVSLDLYLNSNTSVHFGTFRYKGMNDDYIKEITGYSGEAPTFTYGDHKWWLIRYPVSRLTKIFAKEDSGEYKYTISTKQVDNFYVNVPTIDNDVNKNRIYATANTSEESKTILNVQTSLNSYLYSNDSFAWVYNKNDKDDFKSEYIISEMTNSSFAQYIKDDDNPSTADYTKSVSRAFILDYLEGTYMYDSTGNAIYPKNEPITSANAEPVVALGRKIRLDKNAIKGTMTDSNTIIGYVMSTMGFNKPNLDLTDPSNQVRIKELISVERGNKMINQSTQTATVGGTGGSTQTYSGDSTIHKKKTYVRAYFSNIVDIYGNDLRKITYNSNTSVDLTPPMTEIWVGAHQNGYIAAVAKVADVVNGTTTEPQRIFLGTAPGVVENNSLQIGDLTIKNKLTNTKYGYYIINKLGNNIALTRFWVSKFYVDDTTVKININFGGSGGVNEIDLSDENKFRFNITGLGFNTKKVTKHNDASGAWLEIVATRDTTYPPEGASLTITNTATDKKLFYQIRINKAASKDKSATMTIDLANTGVGNIAYTSVLINPYSGASGTTGTGSTGTQQQIGAGVNGASLLGSARKLATKTYPVGKQATLGGVANIPCWYDSAIVIASMKRYPNDIAPGMMANAEVINTSDNARVPLYILGRDFDFRDTNYQNGWIFNDDQNAPNGNLKMWISFLVAYGYQQYPLGDIDGLNLELLRAELSGILKRVYNFGQDEDEKSPIILDPRVIQVVQDEIDTKNTDTEAKIIRASAKVIGFLLAFYGFFLLLAYLIDSGTSGEGDGLLYKVTFHKMKSATGMSKKEAVELSTSGYKYVTLGDLALRVFLLMGLGVTLLIVDPIKVVATIVGWVDGIVTTIKSSIFNSK